MRLLASSARRTSALAQRHDLWPVERTPQAIGQRSWHGPDRGVPSVLAGPAWATVVGTLGIGTGLCREGGVQFLDHAAADRDVVGRQDVTPAVRLAARGRSAQ